MSAATRHLEARAAALRALVDHCSLDHANPFAAIIASKRARLTGDFTYSQTHLNLSPRPLQIVEA
jgi:hypothetical protein